MSLTQPDRPLGRDLPCPSCSHPHLYLACEDCGCADVVIPGVTL